MSKPLAKFCLLNSMTLESNCVAPLKTIILTRCTFLRKDLSAVVVASQLKLFFVVVHDSPHCLPFTAYVFPSQYCQKADLKG